MPTIVLWVAVILRSIFFQNKISRPTATVHTNLMTPKSKNRLLSDFCLSCDSNDINFNCRRHQV